MTKHAGPDRKLLHKLTRSFEMQAARNFLVKRTIRGRREMLMQYSKNSRGSIIVQNDLIPGGRTNLSRNAVYPQIRHLATEAYLLVVMETGRALRIKGRGGGSLQHVPSVDNRKFRASPNAPFLTT